MGCDLQYGEASIVACTPQPFTNQLNLQKGGPFILDALGRDHASVLVHVRPYTRSRGRDSLVQCSIRTSRGASCSLPEHHKGPWRTIDDLELATLGRVPRHDTQRLQGYLGDVPPAEYEEAFYAEVANAKELLEIK